MKIQSGKQYRRNTHILHVLRNDLLRAHGILPPLPNKTESDNDEKNDTASDAAEASPGSEWEDLEDDQVVQAYM